MTYTISILGAGQMGSAVARRLSENGATVLSLLEGRSPESAQRAAAAGMQPASRVPFVESDCLLSIVPPSQALGVLQDLAPTIAAAGRRPLWIDFNAVGPDLVGRLAAEAQAAGADFLGGAIVGFPPKTGEAGPAFYLAGPDPRRGAFLGELGLRLKFIEGPVEAAAALKMSYAGITKGFVALAATMILSAERAGAAGALRAELADSQPQFLARIEKVVPDMFPKAYRWVAEMDEIADFIPDELKSGAAFSSFAELYDLIASDLAAGGPLTGFLRSFCEAQTTREAD